MLLTLRTKALLLLSLCPATFSLYILSNREAQRHKLEKLAGGCARSCSWHLDVCCHGDPPEYPHTVQCDIFNKVWVLWLYCLVWLWRCELFSDLSLRHSFVRILQFMSTRLQLYCLSSMWQECEGSANWSGISVCKSEHMCLPLCLCVHAQMCIFTTAWLTYHFRDDAAENWDNAVSKRKPALIKLKEKQAQYSHKHTHAVHSCTGTQHYEQSLEIPFCLSQWIKPGGNLKL